MRGTVRWVAPALVLVLLVPAAALTAARLGLGSGTLAVQMVAFAPFALPAYAVAAPVLLLVGAAALRGRRAVAAAAWLGLGMLAVAGLVLHARWVVPWFVADAPAAAAGAEPLTVLSTNLRFGEGDAAQVVAEAVRSEADVVVVQEITPEALVRLERAGLGELLPHRAGRPASGALGTMVFAAEPITDVRRLPTGMGSWSMRVAGLDLVAVHPAYPLAVERWHAEHAALRDAVAELRPDLVVGDLNATLDHEPVRDLLALGYDDAAAMTGAGWQPTWPADGSVAVAGVRPPPVVQIDHVLVGDRFTALRTRTVEVDGADHLALVAELARR